MPEPALTKRVHRVKACIALKTLIMPMALPLGVVAAMALSAGQALAAKATYPGGVWEPGPARYGATVTDDVPVKENDRLIVSYRPEADAPYEIERVITVRHYDRGSRIGGAFIDLPPHQQAGAPILH